MGRENVQSEEDTGTHRLLTTQEVSEYIRVSTHTLERWRLNPQVEGPPVIRIGPRVYRYDQADLDKWIRSSRIPQTKG